MSRKYPGTYPLNKSKTKWGFRIKKNLPDGTLLDTSRKEWPKGVSFNTSKEAYEAREKFWNYKVSECKKNNENQSSDVTLGYIYNSYINSEEANSKAASTIRKHKSLWEQHIKYEFENVPLSEISVQDMSNYLIGLYYKEDYSYGYVEGFLKVFYLLYGYAYRTNKIGKEAYDKMFVDKKSRLSMPKMKQEDADKQNEDVKVYNEWELYTIENILKQGDAHLLTAFYIARYCGLRIGEVFGLRWSDIDYRRGVIQIKRQLKSVDGVLTLCEVKTLKASREIMMPGVLQGYLAKKQNEQEAQQKRLGKAYRNTEIVYDAVKKKDIVGGDFINRKNNGELLTENSVKYWVKEIEKSSQIHLKFHDLRHTYATECAANGMNHIMLMEFMGHKKLETTLKYYVSTNNKQLLDNTRKLVESIFAYKDTIPDNPQNMENLKKSLSQYPSAVPIPDEELEKFSKLINGKHITNYKPFPNARVIGTAADLLDDED